MSQSDGWVNVNERLPEIDKAVLAFSRFNSSSWQTIAWLDKSGHFYAGAYQVGYVTHWRPLPEPPKE